VVDAMLLPQETEGSERNEEASNFRKIFIKTGGFNAVVDLLLRRTIDRRRTLDTTLGHGVSHFCFGIALRIAKFCVLGGLVGKGMNVVQTGIVKVRFPYFGRYHYFFVPLTVIIEFYICYFWL
jgi:hypothetical protein